MGAVRLALLIVVGVGMYFLMDALHMPWVLRVILLALMVVGAVGGYMWGRKGIRHGECPADAAVAGAVASRPPEVGV